MSVKILRKLFWFSLLLFLLTSCSQPRELPPTPLPTAVPPPQFSAGEWAISFSYEFPENAWADGVHRYQFFARCPVITLDDFNTEWVFVEVTDQEAMFEDPIYLRINGLSEGILAPVTMNTVNPEQQMVAVITFLGVSEHIAELAAENCEVFARWDDKPPQLLSMGKVFLP
jgi:hypothetical protein